jgi:putative oxidoreductase
MKALTTIVAKLLYAVPMLLFGIMHFMNAQAMSGMVPGFLPAPAFWVYLTGLALVAAGVSIITGYKAKLASLLLAAMLGTFVVFVHFPGVMNADTMQMAMPMMLKDMALAGGALIIAGISK